MATDLRKGVERGSSASELKRVKLPDWEKGGVRCPMASTWAMEKRGPMRKGGKNIKPKVMAGE